MKNLNKKITSITNYFWYTIKEGSKSNSYFNYDNYLKKYPDVKEANINPFKHYLLHGIDEDRTSVYNASIKSYTLVEKSNFFDYEFYCKESNIEFSSYSKALLHYLEEGYKEGYNPSPYFDGEEYYKFFPKAKESGMNPLVHFLKYGKKEKLPNTKKLNLEEYQLIKNSKLFNYKYYIKENNLDLKNETEAIYHYLEEGYETYSPSKKFNRENYLKINEDIEELNELNPLIHYLKYGKKEERSFQCDKNVKEYDLVKESGLFNYKYYENQCPIDLNSYKRALIHYLDFGYKKGYNPCKYFEGDEYFKRYPEVKRAGFNPLVHYLKFGIKEERIGLKQSDFKNFNETYNVNAVLENIYKKVKLIIPIENIENSRACIENISKTSQNHKIILLNQKFGDEELADIYRESNIKVINVSSQESFIEELNDEVDNAQYDVIFLKDNIRTFNKWILKLTMAAYSNARIGFVSPISNYSNLSLIDLEGDEKSLEFVNKISKKEFNESPLPNDSCVFIKKDVFKELKLDEESNYDNWLYNFVTTGNMKGWKSILDDSTYVHYKFNEREYNPEEEYEYSSPYLLENQPRAEFVNSEAFKNSFDNISDFKNENIEEEINKKTKKNILFSMHFGGGVEFTVIDIANSIKDDFGCYVLRAYETKMRLYKVYNKYLILIKEFDLKYKWTPQMVHSEEYKQIYFYILVNYNIDIVEMDHLLLHTFDLAEIAERLHIPIILTLHDFYYICPSYFLLDENNKYCGGYCGNIPRNCSTRVTWIELPANIVEWKHQWQEYMKDLFKKCDYIITATDFTKNMFLEHYDELDSDDITIIEHGRDLIRFDNNYTIPNQYQPIKILIPGVIGPHKGLNFIKDLIRLDEDKRLEFHFIGQVDAELESLGIYHGPYEREDFAKWVFKIKPSFIGIFSVCAETYSHTLTEAICSGVPVLASDLGALKTRIESQGGGWLININDIQETYAQILEISKDPDNYMDVTKNLGNIKIPSLEEMGSKYKEVYQDLIKKYEKE